MPVRDPLVFSAGGRYSPTGITVLFPADGTEEDLEDLRSLVALVERRVRRTLAPRLPPAEGATAPADPSAG